MRYRDTPPPEGINVTQRHPLKELALLLAGGLLVVVIGVFLLSTFGGYLARLVPPAWETSLVAEYAVPPYESPNLEAYLQGLADRIAADMDMPEGLEVQVHVADADIVNAFATLGGHVVLFRGLLEKIPHENALAFLIAHELAHLKHRDPISAVGQGAFVGLGLSLVLGSTSAPLLESAGLLTSLTFSREMEADADQTALASVARHYGHTAGAADLIELLVSSREKGFQPPEFFSTHPDPEARIKALRASAVDAEAVLTPLPEAYRAWLAQ